MSNPIDNLSLFSLSFFFGMVMILEGILIVKLNKQIVPLPSKILYWIGVGLIGKKRSFQWIAEKYTPQNLQKYANFALVFGTSLVVSSVIFLNAILSKTVGL